MRLKNKCLVLLFKPEQKPNKDPPMIVVPSAPIAQNAMLCVCANQPYSFSIFVYCDTFLHSIFSPILNLKESITTAFIIIPVESLSKIVSVIFSRYKL